MLSRSGRGLGGFFNFIAFVIFGTKVAATIANGVVQPDVISIGVIFVGLIGAIIWNVVTAYLGLPSSSSHALVGGMVGAAVAKAGFNVLITRGCRPSACSSSTRRSSAWPWPSSLIVGIMWIVHRIRRPRTVNRSFRVLQLVSAAAFSLGHGSNDAQKTMGIILALLIAAGHLGPDADVPLWVVLSSHTAIALGTLFGGWRIVRTMGTELTRLTPMGGVCAESSAAAVLFFVSTTASRVDHPHHHRRDRRGRLGPPAERRALERGPPGRVGVGAHHSRLRPRRGHHVLDLAVFS